MTIRKSNLSKKTTLIFGNDSLLSRWLWGASYIKDKNGLIALNRKRAQLINLIHFNQNKDMIKIKISRVMKKKYD